MIFKDFSRLAQVVSRCPDRRGGFSPSATRFLRRVFSPAASLSLPFPFYGLPPKVTSFFEWGQRVLILSDPFFFRADLPSRKPGSSFYHQAYGRGSAFCEKLLCSSTPSLLLSLLFFLMYAGL